MYLDEFDPYSPRRRAQREAENRRAGEAFRRGLQTALGTRRSFVPHPHATPSGRQLPGPGETPRHWGVMEEEDPFPGQRCFVLQRADGSRLARIELDETEVDERMIAWLWRVLEAKAPRPAALKVV